MREEVMPYRENKKSPGSTPLVTRARDLAATSVQPSTKINYTPFTTKSNLIVADPLFKNHITREGDAVKKTEFITEMNDVEKSLDKVRWGEESKRLIMNFAEDMKYIDNGLGEIDGVLTLIDRVTMLWHLTNCFGESFYVGFDVLTNNTPERIERYRREDEEERENIEKAEVVLRFARIIKKYDMKGWTEEVRATFMRELKYLEDRLRNRSVPQKA